MKKAFLFIVVVATLLISCNRAERTVFSVETGQYEIVSLDPPKHVYVDLKRVADGRVFTHVYVSKHLNNWGNVRIGSVITLNRYTYSDGSTDVIEFDNSEILDVLESF
jgi:hypothetical protein